MSEEETLNGAAEAAELETAAVTIGIRREGGEPAPEPTGETVAVTTEAAQEAAGAADGAEVAGDETVVEPEEPDGEIPDEPEDTAVVREVPFKEVTARDGETWVEVYCGDKTLVIKVSQIAAMTMTDDGYRPLVHLANAKDVLRIDAASWAALREYLFGGIKD